MPTYVSIFTLCLFGALLGGCLGLNPKVQPVHFYVLSASAPEPIPIKPELPGGLGVGVVELPEYLKTDKLTTRVSNEELQYADYSRWAEPLERGLTRTLAENLSALTGLPHVAVAPWRTPHGHVYVLSVVLDDVSLHSDGKVIISARWALREGSHVCLTGQELIEEKATLGDGAAYTAALNRAWGEFATQVARALSAYKPKLKASGPQVTPSAQSEETDV